MNVLIVAADRRTRSTLEVVFAQRGYRVSVQDDPAEAHDALRRSRFVLSFVELNPRSYPDRDALHAFLQRASERHSVLIGVVPQDVAAIDVDEFGDRIHHLLPAPLDVPALRILLDDLEGQVLRTQGGDYDLSGRVATPNEIDSLLHSDAELDFILDAERRVRYIRPGLEQIAGFRTGELIGRDFVELVDPQDNDLITRAIESAETVQVRLQDASNRWTTWQITVQERNGNGERRGHRVIGARLPHGPQIELTEQPGSEPKTPSTAVQPVAPRSTLDEHLERLQLLVLTLDGDLRVQSWPSFTASRLGRPAEDAIGIDIVDLEILPVADIFAALATGAPNFQVHSEVARDDGASLSVRWYGSVHRQDGEIESILLVGVDESEHEAVEDALRRSEQRFRALVEYSADLIFVFDAEGRTLYMSPSVERLFHGQQDFSFEGERMGRLHPDDRETAEELFARVLESPDAIVQDELRLRDEGDRWRTYQVMARNLLEDFSVQGVVVNAHDITNQREAEADLRRSELRFRALVQNSSDLLAILADGASVRFISPAVERILGYSVDDMIGRQLTDVVHEEDVEDFETLLSRLGSANGESSQIELRMRHFDGSWRVVEAHCTNLHDEPGIAGMVVNARDITERKRLERRLTRRAFLDPLTGLPNRSLFLHRLERALREVPERQRPLAVLFLDIDRFKVVNDSLGHEIGDQLLIAIGRRLQGLVRPADTVARFGGDEMMILLAGITDASEAALIAQRIIEQLSKPIQLQQHEVSVAASVGIAVSTEGQEEANDLIRNADIALYRAKEAGSGRYVVFDESMASRVRERLMLESELRRAIEHGQFRLEYLPEIDLASGGLIGLEVLVRWQHPERGEIPPDEFMLVANETGLIVPLGRQVLNQACAQLRRWHLDHPVSRDLFLAVNCSAREFQQPDIVDVLLRTIDQHSLKPDQIRLEVDEAVIAADPTAAFDKLHRLRRHGIRLAIDDFGTGYSSLGYLTRVTFDTLKIARRFISGPGGITSNLSIVRAVTSLAHALGMAVTAEGIETREHLTRVRAAGCDFGQGFLFSEPLEAYAVESLLFTSDNDAPQRLGD